MSLKKAVLWAVLPWTVAIGVLHAWLNLNLFGGASKAPGKTFKVGFLPVT